MHPILPWFLVTFLGFYLIQLLIAVGHFFRKTTFWVWLSLILIVPALLAWNTIGNSWVKEDDFKAKGCISLPSVHAVVFIYIVITYTLCFALFCRLFFFIR